MLQQIIRSIVRSVLGRVSDSNKSIRDSVADVDNRVGEFKNQIWADVLDKERRIVQNTLDVMALQRDDESIRNDLYQRTGNLEKLLHAKINTVTGLIDDTNLDSIREIADRIKEDAAQTQSLRADMASADAAINSKIDALLPVELQNKTIQEWEMFIQQMVDQEANVLTI